MVDIESGTFRHADVAEPQLRVDDLAPVRGDGIFEALSYRGGVMHGIDDHLVRLARSAQAMDLPEPDPDLWRRAIDAAVDAHDSCDEIVVRFVISRGVEATGKLTAWVLASPVPQHTLDERSTGIDVVLLDRGFDTDVARRAPWLLMGAKTLSYAVNMAGTRYAKSRGADEVIFLSSDGALLEAPTSTVVLISGNTLYTPDPDFGILHGTTQLELFRRANEFGLTVQYARLTPEDMLEADGVWVVSSVRVVVRVNSVDGKPVNHDSERDKQLFDALY